MRGVLGVAVALMVVLPGVALAQSPDRPVVELGAQGSKRINDQAPVAWALRLTVPLARLTAIEATADIQPSFVFEREFGGRTRRSARGFSAHVRQTVFTSGRWQIFGVLGAGTNRVEHEVPEQILQTPGGPRITPGAAIPIGRYRAGDQPSVTAPPPRADQPDASTPSPRAAGQPQGTSPPPAAWRRVKPGREVWVTTNTGSLLHGDVMAISDSSLSIRERGGEVTIRLVDVRRVEGRDSNKNGFLIGAASGAVAGGLVGSTFWSSVGGSYTPSGSDELNAVLIGAAGGALVGGLLGAVVDGLTPGRETLFRGGTTVVTPVITPTQKAIGVAIRWR